MKSTQFRLDFLLFLCLKGGILVTFPVGCTTPPAGPEGISPVPPYTSVVKAQNERMGKLSHLFGAGVVELQWVDDEGKEHFEPQVNLDLWIRFPRETALRLEKMGDVLFWIGSDNKRYWLFDLLGKPTSVVTGAFGKPLHIDDNFALPVRPDSLLDLLGFMVFPASDVGVKVAVGEEPETFKVVEKRRVVWFDTQSLLPTRVEIFDAEGRSVFVSELRRYVAAYLPNSFVLDRPQCPTLIDISGTEGRMSVKIALDGLRITGDSEGQPWDRVFDFERLRKALRPATMRSSAKEAQ